MNVTDARYKSSQKGSTTLQASFYKTLGKTSVIDSQRRMLSSGLGLGGGRTDWEGGSGGWLSVLTGATGSHSCQLIDLHA